MEQPDRTDFCLFSLYFEAKFVLTFQSPPPLARTHLRTLDRVVQCCHCNIPETLWTGAAHLAEPRVDSKARPQPHALSSTHTRAHSVVCEWEAHAHSFEAYQV